MLQKSVYCFLDVDEKQSWLKTTHAITTCDVFDFRLCRRPMRCFTFLYITLHRFYSDTICSLSGRLYLSLSVSVCLFLSVCLSFCLRLYLCIFLHFQNPSIPQLLSIVVLWFAQGYHSRNRTYCSSVVLLQFFLIFYFLITNAGLSWRPQLLAHGRISYRIVFYIVLHLSQAMCSPLWFSGWYDYYPPKCKVSSKCL